MFSIYNCYIIPIYRVIGGTAATAATVSSSITPVVRETVEVVFVRNSQESNEFPIRLSLTDMEVFKRYMTVFRPKQKF